MKLKVQKLDWKQKVEKLRRIVLSGPAIEDLPPGMLLVLEAWRAHHHGKLTDEEYIKTVQDIQPSGPQLIWEPYSDERGDEEALYGGVALRPITRQWLEGKRLDSGASGIRS